jgi:predicted Zn-dependent protease
VAADLEAAGRAGQAATLMKARYALERGDWRAAAEIPLAHGGGFDDVTARFARALGAARLEKIEQARAELSGLRALRSGIEQASGAYWAGFVDIYAGAVDGWIAKAEGDADEGLKRMQVAADLDDAREKSIAMENRLVPMRELLGEFLLELGRPVPAGAEFATSLQNAPNRYRSFAGAARAAVAAGDAPKARDYYAKLLKLTLKADSRFQEISEARNYLEH